MGKGIKLSSEWVKCSIKPFGDTVAEQLQSLKKKIYDHKNSNAHLAAELISEMAKRNFLPKANAKLYKN